MSSGLDADLDLRGPERPEPDLEVVFDDDDDLYDDDPYDDDWGLTDLEADRVYDAVGELVDAGPITLAALIEALTRSGEPLSHVDADEAAVIPTGRASWPGC